MTMLLADWPEGMPAEIGRQRRELIVGEPFTFQWQSRALAVAKVVGRPKGSKADVVDSIFTPDRPGLYRFEVGHAIVEAVAFQPRALTLMKRSAADMRAPHLGLRMVANAHPAEAFVKIEVDELEPWPIKDDKGREKAFHELSAQERTKMAPAHGKPGSLLPAEPS